MARRSVEAADALLDKQIPVLDKGFVTLVDYLGDDQRVVEAARVSYAKGTKGYRQDKQLIRYLMRNRHTSPFEQVVLTFHVKLPIFVARQWIRHRTARVNEISGRYSVMEEECYIPENNQLAKQSDSNKQCRSDEQLTHEQQEQVLSLIKDGQKRIYREYHEMLDTELAREIARINLPLSTYTQWYWQMDLHNLFHFLSLRLHGHAQWEIRQYAQKIADCTKAVAPLCYEAFEDFLLGGMHMSKQEVTAIEGLLTKQLSNGQQTEDAVLEKLLSRINNAQL